MKSKSSSKKNEMLQEIIRKLGCWVPFQTIKEVKDWCFYLFYKYQYEIVNLLDKWYGGVFLVWGCRRSWAGQICKNQNKSPC